MHYLSMGVKQSMCERRVPIIVSIWIPQGSCVHFHSLDKLFWSTAALYVGQI